MRVILSVVLSCGLAGLAAAAEWPTADSYLDPLTDCKTSAAPDQCEYSRATWSEQYANAIRGEYQGQRNVSFCLSTGCDGAIRKNAMLGCAWRVVIIEAGHLEMDSSDTTNMKYFCGSELLDDSGRQAATAQARTLMKMLAR